MTRNLALFLLILFYVSSFFLVEKSGVLFVDENFHYAQIKSLLNGDLVLNTGILMYPGYHLVIAGIGKLLSSNNYSVLRFFPFIFSLYSVIVFLLTAKIIDRKNAFYKTLLYACLPVLFPYFFLLYTDVFSIFLVLAAFYLSLRKKYFSSSVSATLSMFVRQNNLPIVFIYYLWRKSRFYLLGFIIFALGAWQLEGSIGKTFARDNLTLSIYSLSNIYFTLFVLFFLFLPQNLVKFREITAVFAKKKTIFLFFLGFLIYWVSFVPVHPYNRDIWFLHNRIFKFFSLNPVAKTAFYLIIFYEILALSRTKLIKKEYYWFYPAVFFSLLPLSMVEFRYAILPAALILLFQKIKDRRLLVIQGVIFLGLSIFFLWGTVTGNFFP